MFLVFNLHLAPRAQDRHILVYIWLTRFIDLQDYCRPWRKWLHCVVAEFRSKPKEQLNMRLAGLSTLERQRRSTHHLTHLVLKLN